MYNIKRNIIFIIFIFLFMNSLLFAQENPTKNILILNSYHKGYSYSDKFLEGMENVLKSESLKLNLHIEYMDTKRYFSNDYLEKLHEIYRLKFTGINKPDVILCSDDNAFDFLLQYRDELFPGIPIVFCGVSGHEVSKLSELNLVTGITEFLDTEGSIGIAIELHPKTQNVAVISDCSKSGHIFAEKVKKEIGTKFPGVKFNFWNDLTIEELLQKIRTLPKNSIILLWGFIKDKTGKVCSLKEIDNLITETSQVPVYCNWEGHLNFGAFGGKMANPFLDGKMVAETAIQILQEGYSERIPVVKKCESWFMFNYEQMQRFGINISDLPEESIILNKPHSFYEKNKILIWCVIVFVALQMSIIINFILNITKRKKMEKNLLKEKAFSTTLIQASPVFFVAIDKDGKIIMMNNSMLTALGYTSDEVVGGDYLSTFVPEEDHELLSQVFKNLIQNHQKQLNENLILKKDGKTLLVEWHGRSILDEQGNFDFFFGVGIDITERKKAEQALSKHREHLKELVKERTAELEEKTAKLEESQKALTLLLEDVNESRAELDITNKKLEAANKELEAFAYSVSHDLRAPLRNIDGFSQILLEDYSDIVDKQGQHYLQRVRAGTQNMGQLIDDILSLSRSGRHHMDKKTINIESIVKEVCKSLENELNDRKVDFIVRKCPTVFADSHLVKIMFTNLLSNALKFTRIRENAKIETGSIAEDGYTVFFIKDNGVGFDMKYADKLFIPFQRLHRAEEYEGSGIGLAIVQRIIHRHGGRIWAESEIDVGTTFYFTFTATNLKQDTFRHFGSMAD